MNTDLDNARDILRRRPHMRYVGGTGWLMWDASRAVWRPYDDRPLWQTMQEIGETRRRMADTKAEIADARYALSEKGMGAAVKMVSKLPEVWAQISDFDRNPDVLGAGGMVFDLRTGDCRPSQPEDMITRMLSTTPGSYSSTSTCPQWEAFLESCFPGKPELVGYLQRLVGYGITGHTSEQIMILMQGGGGNGKSVFQSTLSHVLKEISVDVPSSALMQSMRRDGEAASPYIMTLQGARMVWTNETGRDEKLAEAQVKLLTGGDPVPARKLHGHPIIFVPSCLIWMTTNHLPEVRGTDEGIWRRVKVIEWAESFVGREDRTLADKLKAEAPGILEWCLRGAWTWYACGGLDEPDLVRSKTDDYRLENDALDGFFPGMMFKDGDHKMLNGEVYAAYRDWCAQEGTERPWSNRAVFRALRERGVERWISGPKSGYYIRRAF